MIIIISSCQDSINARSKIKPPPPPPIVNRNISDLYFSKDTSSLIGIYMSPHYNFGATILGLFADMRYEYLVSGCTSSSIDSGAYVVHSDSIFFNSSFTQKDIDKPITSSHGHKIILSSAKLGKHKVLFGKEAAVRLYRKGMKHFETDDLDTNGSGEAFKLDDEGYLIEEGAYKNYKLHTGVCYIFSEGEATPRRIQIENFKVMRSKE